MNPEFLKRNVHRVVCTTSLSLSLFLYDKTCESRSQGVDRLELGIFKTNALSGANDKIQQRDSNLVGNAYSYRTYNRARRNETRLPLQSQ